MCRYVLGLSAHSREQKEKHDDRGGYKMIKWRYVRQRCGVALFMSQILKREIPKRDLEQLKALAAS